MPSTAARRPRRGAVVTAATATALLFSAGIAHADLTPDQLRSTTDHYLFELSIDAFAKTRAERPHAPQLDWVSDNCSMSPDQPLGYDFRESCQRHDFGYRNYTKQQRFTEPNRKLIDDNFRDDMYTACGADLGCQAIAEVYHFAVRQFGDTASSTADAIDQANISALVNPVGDLLSVRAVDARGAVVEVDVQP
ncbi:phospholipase [Saccharopolyspora cebuensis]|uniref:Phospholipase n=1 Tax=Saccharopolyspora cebuensis TaxID=418759 RepID=A0ABV4CNJ8_9PSEU